ncbi:heme binding protein [Actinidia rufa]|uniref:Heme binding protein n=1 Tax=Actinidia rufa TaxID=165716 RepID=A0A7J0G112_9ERIC|nr:heme binding protein [Actinidia rufa]
MTSGNYSPPSDHNHDHDIDMEAGGVGGWTTPHETEFVDPFDIGNTKNASIETLQRWRDVQFTIGQSSKFSVAFWYPVDGNPWHGSGHYTISCEWVPLDISPGSSVPMKMASGNSWNAASAFALLLSVVAFCIYFCQILGFI